LDPVNGQILALQGGSKFATTQFDRATQSRFEPGFVFVPLMVGVALDAGFTALSPIDESPIGARPGKSSTTIADVLVSGKLDQLMPVFAELGSGTVTGLMQSLGLEDHREVSVIEVARAFATLANRGVPPRLSAITKVEGAEGQVVYDAPQATAEYSFSPQAAMIVRSMLQERKGSKPWIVFVPPTSDPRMAWAVAVRPEAVVAIWVGVDTGPAVLSPARLVKAARRLVTEIADGVAPSRKWEIPAGISYGRFAKGQVPFMSGTEPKTF
jgi:penicillin-binding protein 1A